MHRGTQQQQQQQQRRRPRRAFSSPLRAFANHQRANLRAVRMPEDSEGSWGKSTAQDPSEFSMFTGVLILF
jgi:hypothetical protein